MPEYPNRQSVSLREAAVAGRKAVPDAPLEAGTWEFPSRVRRNRWSYYVFRQGMRMLMERGNRPKSMDA